MVNKYVVLITVGLLGLSIAIIGAGLPYHIDSQSIFYYSKPLLLSRLFFYIVIFLTSLAIFYLFQLFQYKDKLQSEIQKQAQTAIELAQAQQQLEQMNELLESEITSQTEELAVQAEALNQKNQLLEQEIEQRIQVEQTLRRSKKRFYTILNHLPAYVYLHDENNKLHYANQYFYKTFAAQATAQVCYETPPTNQSNNCVNRPAHNILTDINKQPQRWECKTKNDRIYSVQAYLYEDIDGTQLVLEMGVDIT
jgi:PAS domain-containing protein